MPSIILASLVNLMYYLLKSGPRNSHFKSFSKIY